MTPLDPTPRSTAPESDHRSPHRPDLPHWARSRWTQVSAGLFVLASLIASACNDGGGTAPAPDPGTFASPGLGFPTDPAPTGAVSTPNILPSLTFEQPTFVAAVPGLAPALVVGEKTGRIWLVTGDRATPTRTEFLNLRAELASQGGELGMLGIAFDPDFGGTDPAFNDVVYVSFTRTGPLRSVLSRFRVDAAAPVGQPFLDPASEEVLLETPQPFTNHNAGDIEFAPDGTLLYAIGDGGDAGDPFDHAQNRTNLLGTMVRIDVRGTPDTGLAYAIPSDNPFFGSDPAVIRPEIWAYGLRNPWQFCVDPRETTLTVIAGDVGQSAREEVARIRNGENHGWRVREGRAPFTTSTNRPPGDVLVEPIWDYPHSVGISVTGGRVYRGTLLPQLRDHYLFCDLGTGRFWALASDAADPNDIGIAPGVVAFGEDHDQEMLLVNFSGSIHRVEPGVDPAPGAPATPSLLSETGIFADLVTLTPASNVWPYEVAVPHWNGPVATVSRHYLALPAAMALPEADRYDDAFVAPTGTVAVHHLEASNGRRLETRVLVRTLSGWRAYNYVWRTDGSDADLQGEAPTTIDLGTDGLHVVPSRSDCMQCHRPQGGTLRGLNAPQWSTVQRLSFQTLGLLEGDLGDPALPAPLVDPDGSEGGDAEARARSFLSVNCGSCHRPDTGIGAFDLRATTPLASAGLIDVVSASGGTVGLPGADLVEPGDPNASVLYLRALSQDGAARMPAVPGIPLGQTQGSAPDPDGLAALLNWIQGL